MINSNKKRDKIIIKMYYNILGLSFLPNKRKYFLYYLSGGNYKKKWGG